MEKMLNAQEVAQLYGVTVQTIYRWVKSRKLRARRIGRTIRFRAGDLER